MARRRIRERGTVVDLFCGCGGFSLGAGLAGFRSIASIDIDPTLQSAYRRNFPETEAKESNLAKMDASDWRAILGKGRPDGLVGGPPCQGFSWIGRRRKNDPRNSLLHHFYRHVRFLRPKFFVMENVEGLLSEENVDVLNSALDSIPGRYRVMDPVIVNAMHFGAATSRRRVVVIGYDPEYVDPISPSVTQAVPRADFVTVRDAISDLPGPVPGITRGNDFGWARYPTRAAHCLSEYAHTLRMGPPKGLGWDEAVERHGKGFVSGTVATEHSRRIARRYAVVAGGYSDPITKSYKLEWDGQCPTLRAGTGMDKGAFQAVRPLHPGKGRVITVREAARLQGFPDWFVFHQTKWHSFRMIGNSISPFVSKTLLARIASKMHAGLAA
jgi:DNA (cytosine-5)-methyltransferase 1